MAKAVSGDLWALGLLGGRLRGRDPEELYERRALEPQGMRVDRCMLYTFRCAVYFASHERHDPELLKWWNWKDV